ncbi:hypothetical protein Syun_009618 [Stephania yunnanensis]|uniref:Uncharacterized protein n=1 Tax=Stephania yunnanensis TaxID=152371 RepID=A0AAP0KGR1_9MAGN
MERLRPERRRVVDRSDARFRRNRDDAMNSKAMVRFISQDFGCDLYVFSKLTIKSLNGHHGLGVGCRCANLDANETF